MHLSLSLALLLAVGPHAAQSTPTNASYFDEQIVNHFSAEPHETTYVQRFYESSARGHGVRSEEKEQTEEGASLAAACLV
mmetsp:Transcript_22996/g.45888  ORF Transcript_22996/g.45888 Transcript_22996/m.45888 type:complete len:80 (-) Transcript_22996:1456-1695(-)